MNIVLTGFMGTGKTAVGRHLAAELKAKFVDVDMLIAEKAGRSIREIFDSQGEAAFRKQESAAIHEVAAQDKVVIATGGGALMNPTNRETLAKHGILVCLTARMGTLLERLKEDHNRPLLQGEDTEKRIESLMAERQAVYNLCPIQVDTDGKTIAAVAKEIIQKVAPQWGN